MRLKALFFVLLSICVIAGCTSPPREEYFSNVQKTVADRTGSVIHWRTDSAEDAEADRAVRELLAQPLTAEAAAQIALLNYRHLQATFEEIGIAQADLVQAGLLKNPVFDLGIRFPTRSPSKTYLDMSIASDFIELFLIPARKKLAGAALRQAELRVTDQVLATVAQTKTDFYRYQAAVQMLELRKQVADAADASSETARRLQEAGNISELDVLAEQTQDVRTKVELNEAQAEMAAAREAVNKDFGLVTGADSWKPASRLGDPPSTEIAGGALEEFALRNRQDVAAARQELELQTSTLVYARGTRFLPTLTAGVEAERETDGQWRIGPTFAVPVPLFDQGQGAVARQEAILRLSRARYEGLCADVRSEVRSASAKLKISREKAALYHDKVLPLQQKLVEQTQLHFNGMFVGVFQLLQARRDEISAGGEYIAAVRDYWTARAELERATGGGSLPLAQASTRPSTSQPATTEPHDTAPEAHEHYHGDHHE
jgi:cobalt-zinc-cadmium efflux system outer membrane protein